MTRAAVLALVAVLLAGCGVDTIRVSTVPEGARLYANAQYVGLTPRSVPARFGLGRRRGDAVMLRIDKEGYRTFERNITALERWRRYREHNFVIGSEYGRGVTFPYTFHLEKGE